MAVAKITGQGLTAIAVSVGLLWGCLVGERLIVRHANEEASRTIYELRVMKHRRDAQPVAAPRLKVPRPAMPFLG